MTAPAFPASGSTSWYPWASSVDNALRAAIVLQNPTGVDDSAAWSAALASVASAGGGRIAFRGHHKIPAQVLAGAIGDNCEIYGLDKSAWLEFTWVDGQTTTPSGTYLGNKTQGTTFTGSITSGAAVLTASASVFTAAMVGLRVYIPTAGVPGGLGASATGGLTAYIKTYTSPTQVTLDRNANNTVTANTGCIIANGNQGIHLHHFRLSGGNNGLPSGPNSLYTNLLATGLFFQYVNGLRIHDMEIDHIPGIAISYRGCEHVWIHNNRIHDTGRDAITGGPRVGGHNWIHVFGNTVFQNGDDMIASGFPAGGTQPDNNFERPHDLAIFGNTLVGDQTSSGLALGRGIVVFGTEKFAVFGNTIEGAAGDGIRIDDSSNGTDPSTGNPWRSRAGTVAPNTIRDAGQALAYSTTATAGSTYAIGLHVKNSDDILATPNNIFNSYQADVWQEGCTNVNAHGNQVRASDGSLADPLNTRARAVATSNVASLSGTATIDGVTLVAGDTVLLTGQTTATQNGPWQIPPTSTDPNVHGLGTAWVRPNFFPTGLGFYDREVVVTEGTAYAGSRWRCTSASKVIVDTSSQTWTNEATGVGYTTTVRMGSDATAVNNSVSLVTSGVLTAALPANTTWRYEADIYYDATTTADAKFGWAIPTGATGKWAADGLVTTTAGTNGSIQRAWADVSATLSIGAAGEGTTVVAKPSGSIVVGSTAGTFAVKYAQATASADPVGLVIRAGSMLRLTRIA